MGRLPETVRHGLTRASIAVQGLALLWTLPLLGVTLLGPVAWAGQVWSGAPGDLREAVTVSTPWPPDAETVPVVLAVVAVVLVLAVRDAVWRPRALTGVLVLAWATALVLPAVLEVPYVAGLVALGITTAGTLAAAAWIRPSERPEKEPAAPQSATASAIDFPTPRPTATVLALLASLTLAILSLTSEPSTLAVLSTLTALFAAASWKPHLAPITAPTALAYAAALACATGAAADWQPQYTALLVLAVPVAAALLAARLGGSPTTVPVESAGAVAGLLAVGLTAASADLPMLALVLALCGVITAGTAIRTERRPVAYASAALFVLATWVRLAAWDVGTPEAYTLPVTVPALLVGALHRRRDPQASSWTAYGPGLAATLLPSLLTAWGDPNWTRPLLLGAGGPGGDPAGRPPPSPGAPVARWHGPRPGRAARTRPVHRASDRRTPPLGAAGPGRPATARTRGDLRTTPEGRPKDAGLPGEHALKRPVRGAGLYRYAAPPRGRDQPQRTRSSPQTITASCAPAARGSR